MGSSSTWNTVSSETARVSNVEPVQPVAPVGLGRSDGGWLDDDDAVELRAFGQRGRDDINLTVRITVDSSQERRSSGATGMTVNAFGGRGTGERASCPS